MLWRGLLYECGLVCLSTRVTRAVLSARNYCLGQDTPMSGSLNPLVFSGSYTASCTLGSESEVLYHWVPAEMIQEAFSPGNPPCGDGDLWSPLSSTRKLVSLPPLPRSGPGGIFGVSALSLLSSVSPLTLETRRALGCFFVYDAFSLPFNCRETAG